MLISAVFWGRLRRTRIAETSHSVRLYADESIERGLAGHFPASFRGAAVTVRVEAGLISRQTSPAGPTSEFLDRLGRCHGDRHDILCGGRQRDIQQSRQTTARTNLGTGPVVVLGSWLIRVEIEHRQVDLPDGLPLCGRGQVDEKDAIKSARP